MTVRVRRTTSANVSCESHSPFRRRVEDQERLVEVALGVLVDLLVGEDRPLGGASRRVADPRRVVADDENAGVPLVLECAHPLQRDSATDVDVG